MFYGREEQKKKLLDMIQRKEQMISLIYGRRRIGKSELIKHILKKVEIPSIYYECKQTTEQNNVDSLSEIIADTFDFPKPSFRDVEEVLNFLFKKSENTPMILVFDEYPYLCENVKGIDSIIQSVIDKYKDTSQMKIR